MEYDKTCARINRKNKSKDKNNSFFGSQKHIRIKTKIIETARVNNLLGLFNRDGRFRIKIISSLNPNIFFTKEFYGYDMFLAWYLQLINADSREQASDGSLIDYDTIGQDANSSKNSQTHQKIRKLIKKSANSASRKLRRVF